MGRKFGISQTTFYVCASPDTQVNIMDPYRPVFRRTGIKQQLGASPTGRQCRPPAPPASTDSTNGRILV